MNSSSSGRWTEEAKQVREVSKIYWPSNGYKNIKIKYKILLILQIVAIAIAGHKRRLRNKRSQVVVVVEFKRDLRGRKGAL